MEGLLKWIAARLKEPSTYQGLATILTAAGIFLSPELWLGIGTAGAAIVGLVQVIKKEIEKRATPPTPAGPGGTV
ncbi:MAG: hypothetical protein KAJ55_03390 [Anaerolineales bacterium]|nr:hypothetical protein [Anaerolineales bacterium]